MALSSKVAVSYQQNLSATNVTSAFTSSISAVTFGNYSSGKLQYSNSSGQPIVMGLGPTSAVSGAVAYFTLGATVAPIVIEMQTPSNNYIFLKSNSGTLSSGWVTLDFLI